MADRPRSADRKLGASYIQSADQGWSALPVGGGLGLESGDLGLRFEVGSLGRGGISEAASMKRTKPKLCQGRGSPSADRAI